MAKWTSTPSRTERCTYVLDTYLDTWRCEYRVVRTGSRVLRFWRVSRNDYVLKRFRALAECKAYVEDQVARG